jgi:hypothetical protein
MSVAVVGTVGSTVPPDGSTKVTTFAMVLSIGPTNPVSVVLAPSSPPVTTAGLLMRTSSTCECPAPGWPVVLAVKVLVTRIACVPVAPLSTVISTR